MTTVFAVNELIFILTPEQGGGGGYAMHLEHGEDNASYSLKTLPNDVAGWGSGLWRLTWKRICCFRVQPQRWPPAKKKKTKTGSKAPNWKRGTNVSDSPTWVCIPPLLEIRPELCLLEPFQIFKLLLNDEICNLIIRESERYAAQHYETIKNFQG